MNQKEKIAVLIAELSCAIAVQKLIETETISHIAPCGFTAESVFGEVSLQKSLHTEKEKID